MVAVYAFCTLLHRAPAYYEVTVGIYKQGSYFYVICNYGKIVYIHYIFGNLKCCCACVKEYRHSVMYILSRICCNFYLAFMVFYPFSFVCDFGFSHCSAVASLNKSGLIKLFQISADSHCTYPQCFSKIFHLCHTAFSDNIYNFQLPFAT